MRAHPKVARSRLAIESLEPRTLLASWDGSPPSAVMPDGRIVSAGTVYLYHNVYDEDVFGLSLSRRHADGTPDQTFSDDGSLTDDDLNAEDYSLRLTDLAVASDGTIAVSGMAGHYMIVALYGVDGERLLLAERDIAHDWDFYFTVLDPEMAFRPDDTLIVAGYNPSETHDSDFVVTPFFGPGSFGDQEWIVTDFAQELETSASDEAVLDIYAHVDNSFTVVGLTQALQPDDDGLYPMYLAIARYTAVGDLDNSFGADGLAVFPIGSAAREPSGPSADVKYAIDAGGGIVADFTHANTGESKIVRFDRSGNALVVPQQEPFPAASAQWTRIEAENFDQGGEGVAYHDADPANRGNAYRSSGVDIGPTSDTDGGFSVGWTEPGEWLEYTIEIDSPGTYNILTRVANPAPGASFHIELDGIDVTGPIAVPDTGSWHRSKTAASRDINIAAGEHVLRLAFDQAASNGAVGNFNWLRLVHGIDVTFGEAGVAPAGGWLLPEPGGTTVSVYYDGLSRLSADGTSLTKISDTFRWAEVHDALLQPDGKILVAADEAIADRRANVLRRFNRDGSLDATFSRAGYFQSDTPIVRLAIQPDGRILADSGTTIRLFPDGTRDIGFPSLTGTLAGVAADGTIYTYATEFGACNPDSYWPECDRHMHVYRWLPNGDPDRSYADDGLWTVTLREDDEDTPWFWGQAVLPDGSFVSGTIRNNRNDFAGAYESGRFILHPDGRITGSVSASGDHYFHGDLLAARHDSAVILAGRLVNGDDMIFERDWHWGLSGLPATPWRDLFPYHSIHDLAFQEDGKLLVWGSGGVVRFDAPPPRQTPRSPAPWSLGRRIEAEDFDDGGPGVSYHDVEPRNRGGSYRVSQVDVGPTNDAGGGYAVGWTAPGEWLEYTIAVPRDGRYDVDVRAANTAAGARFHVEIDGADVTGRLAVPNTGGFHRSATVTGSRIPLTRGTHVLRLAFDQAASNGAVGNFNWLQLRPLPARVPRPAVRPEVRRTATPASTPTSSTPQAPVLPQPDSDPIVQRRRPVRPAPLW